VGEETIIDKQLDRKGHTRALKDAQRMFNYNASGSVEYGALQSKTPYVGPGRRHRGLRGRVGDGQHREPLVAALQFTATTTGTKSPPPARQPPPTGAPLFMEGMRDAAEWMRMVSGQYQADMGAPSNERSGAAINARQRQGDNATFHFLDHQAIAIRFTAKILLDLIPKIYDTERVVKILAEDGTESTITVDPDAAGRAAEQRRPR
jgi:hypothetical protein